MCLSTLINMNDFKVSKMTTGNKPLAICLFTDILCPINRFWANFQELYTIHTHTHTHTHKQTQTHTRARAFAQASINTCMRVTEKFSAQPRSECHFLLDFIYFKMRFEK